MSPKTRPIRHAPAPPTAQPPLISARWLGISIGSTIAAAAVCAWAALCLLFWQGSWQLLFHPSATISRTPAAVGLSFQTVAFDPDSSGQPQLQGWWIPQPSNARATLLYLHGATGNLSSTVDALPAFAASGLNIFVFDYRGYGQSLHAHPSEEHWRQDAEGAITYLTTTRHIPPSTLIIGGSHLGANLALQVASMHPDLAGVFLDQPLAHPMLPIFSDPRARLVPAHALVFDRFDLNDPASELRIPALWIESQPSASARQQQAPPAYLLITARKTLLWLDPRQDSANNIHAALSRWLGDLLPGPVIPPPAPQ
jgi:pimeloyl-ACP methyl ester carboxylesterase